MPLPFLFYSHRESFILISNKTLAISIEYRCLLSKIAIDNFERLFYNVDNIEYLF